MKIIIIVGAIILLCVALFCFPVVRCCVKNAFPPFRLEIYGVRDIVDYFKYKKYNNAPFGSLVAYCGLFGKGKTLFATHKLISLYNRYNGATIWNSYTKQYDKAEIIIYSNVHLNGVPYVKLDSLAQFVEYTKRGNKDKGYYANKWAYFFIDEASVMLNSRSFKDNIDSYFLNSLLTSRHFKCSLFQFAEV